MPHLAIAVGTGTWGIRNQFEEAEFERIREKVKAVKTDQYEEFVREYVFCN